MILGWTKLFNRPGHNPFVDYWLHSYHRDQGTGQSENLLLEEVGVFFTESSLGKLSDEPIPTSRAFL